MADSTRDRTLTPITGIPIPQREREPGAPAAPAPERAPESLGSRVYAAAAPLVGSSAASDLAAFARLVDTAPKVGEAIAKVLGPASPGEGSQGAPKQAQAPQRWTTAVLFAVVFALVLAGALGVLTEVRDLRAEQQAIELRSIERTAAVQETLARQEGKTLATEAMAKTLRDDLDAEKRARLEDSRTVAILTKHVLARLTAIGERTGADKMASWTETPPELTLVVVTQDVQAARKQGAHGG